MVILVEGGYLRIVARQGLANIFECVCRNYIDFEEILSHANGNFEDQNKILEFSIIIINPLAYTDVCETAGLARSINTQPAVRRNSETNPTSQHNRGMY